MKAIILAGGYATRMHPLTLDIPKQLLKVGGKTVLEHLIDRIIEVGIVDEIFVVTNNVFNKQFLEWEATCKYINLTIKILNDNTNNNEERLGAVGDIMFAINKEKIDDDLMILAGDNLVKSGIRGLHNTFIDKDASVIALHDLKNPKKLAKRFGTVCIDEKGKITDFEEKPEHPRSSLAATMCYIFKREDVHRIKTYIKEGGLVDNGGDLVKYLSETGDVYGYPFDDLWIDIGGIDHYKEACKIFHDYEQLAWIDKMLAKHHGDN